MSIPVLPPSAPFTGDQRAWLNGFMAGVLGVAEYATGNYANGAPANGNGHAEYSTVLPVAEPVAIAAEEEIEHTWHDPALPMDERMQLAEDKPFKFKLMAAMAQLDCGSCGYLCDTYAEAIASGADKNLTKCVPGGKETSKKLKELVATNAS